MLSFLPDFIFPKITDISPDFLRHHGIKLLLMDFDNTMLPYTTDVPTEELLEWISTIKDAEIALCIISNSHKERVPQFSIKHEIACVTHAAKPRTRGVSTAMELYHVPKEQTALVGDQIFTDVLCANLAGVSALAVKSIHNHTIWLKLRHIFEIPFLAIAKKRRVQI